jgi:hypothetical protein
VRIIESLNEAGGRDDSTVVVDNVDHTNNRREDTGHTLQPRGNARHDTSPGRCTDATNNRASPAVITPTPAVTGTSTVLLEQLPRVPLFNVCYEENVRGLEFACTPQSRVDCLRNLFRAVLRDPANALL